MNIAQRIDSLPMTPFLRKVILFVGIGWLFDAMDQGMVSGVIASIGTDWHLDTAQLGLLSSSGLLGMIVGAALSGIAADRWGRRTVIVLTLAVFSVSSALCGLAVNYEMLLICRFLTGFGLGGELPAASTLVSEFSPVASRGRNVVILESFWAWGWIAAALVAYLAIPLYGWRVAFFIGAVPAVFAAILRVMIPESPRYLEARGRHREADQLVRKMEEQAGIASTQVGAAAGFAQTNTAAEQVTAEYTAAPAEYTAAPGQTGTAAERTAAPAQTSLLAGFKSLWSRQHLRSTAVLWVLWMGINLGYYGFVLWTPSLLMAQGFTMVKSFEFTLIMCLAQLPGYLAAAILIERIGRKPILTAFFAGTAAAAWLFGHATSEAQILAFGCLLYFFALGAWGCVYSYTPELYPTDIRGAGTGWAAAFGRIGALIAPMILPVLYALFGAENGYTGVFMLLTGVFLVVAIVVGIFGRETRGEALKGD
ncbi:MAG: MFS transporter [Coriobacteriales bacterium]|jgi:putative MFS transporter|nr:MFS transporter [Coriobacteriales bacterium]